MEKRELARVPSPAQARQHAARDRLLQRLEHNGEVAALRLTDQQMDVLSADTLQDAQEEIAAPGGAKSRR